MTAFEDVLMPVCFGFLKNIHNFVILSDTEVGSFQKADFSDGLNVMSLPKGFASVL